MRNFQNWRKFEVEVNFFVISVTGNEVCHLNSQSNILHFELLIEVLAKKLTELLQFQNLTYFWTWWRHRWRHQHQKLYRPSQIQDTYMCQVWFWLLESCDLYRNLNRQTDKQTNRQTVRRTYLPKLKILASNKPSNEHTCQNCKILASNNYHLISHWTNWALFRRLYFHMQFNESIFFVFRFNFHWQLFLGSNWQ